MVQALRHERIFQAAMADLWCAGELPMAEKIKRLEVRFPAQKGLAQRLRAEATEALTFCSDPRSFYVSATSESASDLHQHFA